MSDDPSAGSGRQMTQPRSAQQSDSSVRRKGRGPSAPGRRRKALAWLGWPGTISRRRAICLAVLAAGALAAGLASGVLLWLACGAVVVGVLGVLMPTDAGRSDRTPRSDRFASVALAVSSVFVGLALLEAVLWAIESAADRPLPEFVARSPASVPLAPELPPAIQAKIERMLSAQIMPPSWQKRDLEKVPGVDDYVWQTVLHVVDANGMRRGQPFPPRDPGRFRIMVVGDSLTYGEGIDAFWTYPEQLERSLATDFRVEVLNLGVRGYASEDVLNVVRRFVPELEPDLVVYGVCLNDFLETGTGPPWHYLFPLPEKLKKKFLKRSRVARLVGERYDTLLRFLGLRPGFYADLLTDFDPRRGRFGRDVAALNAFVTASGLPPVIAMVLDQAPQLDGPGRQLAVAAEEQLRAAGIEVVDSAGFYRRFDGRNFRVSRWEGHPNEEAHAIWADMLARAIRGCAELAPFLRADGAPASARN